MTNNTRMKRNDFLEQKRRQLNMLTTQQNSALSMVNNTITNLQKNNEEIASVIADIEEYRRQLEAEGTQLSSVKDKNTRIIENFKRLIEG